MRRDVCLWAIFGIVLVAGIGIAVVDTAWNLLLGCPDFTGSQSGDGGDQSWIAFPPGPVCRTHVRYDGISGTHVDYPSWARVLAIVAWAGWLTTIAIWGWSRHRARVLTATQESQIAVR